MGLNLNILSFGQGSSNVSGTIVKYPTAASLPGSAADGDVAIVLDTNNLYSYDTGAGGWVIIGGPGVAVTVSDTNSIDTAFLLNDISSNLRIPPGITGVPGNFIGLSLQILAGASPGLASYLGITGNVASGSSNGFLLASDWTTFNSKVGLSSIIQTIFPLFGGTNIPASGGITLQIAPASGVTAGYVTITGQTYSGLKSFSDGIALKDGTSASLSITKITDPNTGWAWDGAGTQIYYAGSPGNNAFGIDGNGVFIYGGRHLRMYNSGANAVAIRTPSGILSDWNWYWPVAQGAANSVVGNADGAGGMSFFTTAYQKSLLGISGNNFGDVTLGTFNYLSFAKGLTITADQILSAGWGDTTNPGMVGTTHQVWAGDKDTTGNLGTFSYLRFRGASLVSIGSSATSGYTLILPLGQGGTLSIVQNNGQGLLSFQPQGNVGLMEFASAANLTGATTTRFIGVTTTTSDRTIDLVNIYGTTGAYVTVQKLDSGLGNVLINGQSINGATQLVLSGQWSKATLIANGSGFWA